MYATSDFNKNKAIGIPPIALFLLQP